MAKITGYKIHFKNYYGNYKGDFVSKFPILVLTYREPYLDRQIYIGLLGFAIMFHQYRTI